MIHQDLDVLDTSILLLALPEDIVTLQLGLPELSLLPGDLEHEFLDLDYEGPAEGVG